MREEYSLWKSVPEPGNSALQAESGGHNSDSAEEVAWVPERHANPSHLPPSPMAKAVGPECAAAVNLLCMSVHENAAKAAQLQQRSSPGNALKDMPKASFAKRVRSNASYTSSDDKHCICFVPSCLVHLMVRNTGSRGV